MDEKYLGCKQCIKNEGKYRPEIRKTKDGHDGKYALRYNAWGNYKTFEECIGHYYCPTHETMLELIYNIKNENF